MGCQLDTPLAVGDSCTGMQYIVLEQGQRCNRDDCNEYQAYFDVNHCPVNDICSRDSGNNAYCMKDCRSGKAQVICDGMCVDPESSNEHCGAKGFCNSDNENDEHFKGVKCIEGQSCKPDDEGQYRCKCSDGYLPCEDNGVLKCVDPLSVRFCGASGLCNDSNPESENFKGTSCASEQACQMSADTGKYRCTCPNGGILCDNQCVQIDNRDHCGAKGQCNSDSPQSNDYKGLKCGDEELCLEHSGKYSCYPCDITSGTKDYCEDGKCHDIAKDPDNCGRCGEVCLARSAFTDALGNPQKVHRGCEDKKCCYTGELASSNNDYINIISCCSGTEKYEYTYLLFRCLNKTHYGCFTKSEVDEKSDCWKKVE